MVGFTHPSIDRVQTASIVLTVALVLAAGGLLFVFWIWEATRARYWGPVVAITGVLVVGLWVQAGSTVDCIEEAGGRPGGCSFLGQNVRTAFGD